MRNLLIILSAVLLTAVSGFAQATYTGSVEEVAYDSLDATSQKLFSTYGVANPYGELIEFDGIEDADIVGVYRVTDIKKSRKMVTDTTVTPNTTNPEFSTQYMLLYKNSDGNVVAVVTVDDPTINGEDAASISALMNDSGLKQGDDDFGTTIYNDNSTKNVENQYKINTSSDW